MTKKHLINTANIKTVHQFEIQILPYWSLKDPAVETLQKIVCEVYIIRSSVEWTTCSTGILHLLSNSWRKIRVED